MVNKAVLHLDASEHGTYNIVNELGTSDIILSVFYSQGKHWTNYEYSVNDKFIFIDVKRPNVEAGFFKVVIFF